MAQTDTTNTDAASLHTQAHSIAAAGQDTIDLPGEGFVRNAEILRDGQDLLLEGPNGETVIIEGYFAAHPAPVLQDGGGEVLSPQLVQSFVRPAGSLQYAQAAHMTDESPAGAVNEVTGKATVTRTDGTTETITIGTPIYEGDVIETSLDGAVNIVFIDESTFSISEDAKLAIDEYVFDPSADGGSSDFSLLRGIFVFTSGLIGRDDPDDVNINTPMGSIGIRGTVIAGNINTGEITVLEGAIVLRMENGTEMTLAQQFETARFNTGSGTIDHAGIMEQQSFDTNFEAVKSVSPSLFTALPPETHNNGATDTAPAQEIQQQQIQSEPAPEQTGETQPAPSDFYFEPVPSTNFSESAGLSTTGTAETLASPTLVSTAPSTTLSTGATTASAPSSSSTTSLPPLTTTTISPVITAGGTSTSGTPIPPPVLSLNTIGGNAGVILYGAVGSGNLFGSALSAIGDQDGDGFGNFVVMDGKNTSGSYYVFDGNASIPLQSSAFAGSNTSDPDVSGVGDFNGDGAIDFVLGVPMNTGSGSVSIQGAGAFISSGLSAGDLTGMSVAGVGDIDGDGFADVIVGAPGSDDGATDGGSAYILFGNSSAGAIDVGSAYNGLRIDGVTTNNAFGNYVASAGDFNNDGYADFMVSSYNGTSGTVSLFLGSYASAAYDNIADGVLFTGIGTDGIDVPVSGVGDMNGDSYSDIAIVDTAADRVHFVFGAHAPDTDLSNGVNANGFTLYNSGAGTFEGGGSAGDFNGDGYDDFAIALRDGTKADIFILYGKAGLAGTIDVQNLYAHPDSAFHMTYTIGNTGMFDFNIATGGDLNGDGFDDLLVGTPQSAGGDGAVTVVFGKPLASDLSSTNPDMHAAGINGPANVVASSSGDALVGNAGANQLSNMNGANIYIDVNFRAGAGSDVIDLFGTSFRSIDGGTGYDTLNLHGANSVLNFAAMGSEALTGIEKIVMSSSGQTTVLGMSDIFRLLQQSDNGTLTIAGNGNTTNRLLIDSEGNPALSPDPMLVPSDIQSALAATTGETVTSGTSGIYNTFSFGGYTLQIENILIDSNTPSQIV